jgi:hypothetical protein
MLPMKKMRLKNRKRRKKISPLPKRYLYIFSDQDQEASMIRFFYTIKICKIPAEKWLEATGFSGPNYKEKRKIDAFI